MTLIEKMKMIERINSLIRRKATGTPKQLASKLCISERCLFNTLKVMKDMGGPIYFCLSRESYVYEYEVEFSIGFEKPDNSLRKFVGGIRNIFLTAPNVQYEGLHCRQMRI